MDVPSLRSCDFGMYSEAGSQAVRELVASVLLLALDETTTTEHVYAAVKLGLRRLTSQHPEAGDSAVRDYIQDYLESAWQLKGTGTVFHFADFARRRRLVTDLPVAPATRDALARLVALDLAEVERKVLSQRDQLLRAPTINAFRLLGAGRVLRRDGTPKGWGDEEETDVFLRDAGSLAELSFADRPLRLPWRAMLDLLSSLEAGCGPHALAERALSFAA